MTKDRVLQLKYLGVLPQSGHREYGFRIEAKDKDARQVVLTIEDAIFLEHRLMFQEAPDLCYQKLLAEIEAESVESPIAGYASVTSADVTYYRTAHPTTKSRRGGSGKRTE